MFLGNGKDGLFLVRDSSSSVGDFVLSVYHNGQINHFQIRKHAEDAFFSIGNLNSLSINHENLDNHQVSFSDI